MRHERGFIQMKYFVTQVHFAFDEEWISKADREAVTEDHWGIWEADNVQHLCEKLTESSGWLVNDLHFTVRK